MSDSGRPDGRVFYRTLEEIENLLREFEACTLPSKQWTHHAHLTVGLWYIARHPLEEAARRIRYGIQRYNDSCGVRMTPEGGYHETITRFYIWAIHHYLQAAKDRSDSVALTNGLLNSPLAAKTFPLEYYTKEQLMSWDARLHWVEPDLKPLE